MVFDEREFRDQAEREVMEQVDQELNDLADKIFFKSQIMLDEKRTWTSSYSGKTYSAAITDTSGLASSGRVDNSKFLFKVITYDAPHAAAIEFGTEPHRINPEWLEGWIRRKLGLKGQEKQVAQRIAHKIAVAGTDAKPFLRPPINEEIAEGNLQYDVNQNPLGVSISI